MRKQNLMRAASVLTALCCLTGCGTKKSGGDGRYISINGTVRLSDQFRSDVDAALKAVKAEDAAEAQTAVELVNGKFAVFHHLASNRSVNWSGSVSTENGVLHFCCEDATVSNSASAQKYTDQFPMLNEKGAFPAPVMPPVYLSDIAKTVSRLPVCLLRDAETPSIAEMHGDFLCVPAYGMTLDGSYHRGDSFTVQYAPADTLRNDPYSKAYSDEQTQSFSAQPDEAKLSQELQLLCSRYGIPSGDAPQLRLTFSGGKWEMTDAADSTVGKGGYTESKQYPGLIAMYDEPDEQRAQTILENINPLLLYIDSNAIYYPGFVKAG